MAVGPATAGSGADREDSKDAQLETVRAHPAQDVVTTDQGVRIDDTDNSLRAGERGPTLLEDFQAREKLTHFDHERIPERVVHARGSAAYGYFECYEPLTELTCADFLSEAGLRTPVFVRFSTVQGPRGSADTVRDVRGFATKFYTREGNYDLVGNNMPVFFIQDAIKFPDFVHAVKPEPHNEMPTGGTAHDTFWDFCSLQPESTHMLMWAMSDRAIPRSLRMMQGFGVHTFRFVTAEGRGTFVKFHWRPKLGVASQVWDEAQLTAGKDPDFHRRDLWEAIESGSYPEWELGVQLVAEEDESRFDFDILDATKLIPEELVPVKVIGRMVLDRNPENFFAETEQAAFHTANIVPGIDFSNDPLLQGRNFSYLDTQLIRLGGPNFSQLPVNRPVADVHTNHRDGYGQQVIHRGVSYAPNSLSGNNPHQAGQERQPGVFKHYQQRVDGEAIRKRSESFSDHYSQATLFWNSMADWERQHIVDAFRFELGKVETAEIRERMVGNLTHVDAGLARQVAEGLGMELPEPGDDAPRRGDQASPAASPALSQDNLLPGDPSTRKVALLAADGVDVALVGDLVAQLRERGVTAEVVGLHGGALSGQSGEVSTIGVDKALPTTASVLYDAVLLGGGEQSVQAVGANTDARRFVAEAYRHGKPIGALGPGIGLLTDVTGVTGEVGADLNGEEPRSQQGLVIAASTEGGVDGFIEAFAAALSAHRFFGRESAS
ncbi:Catalase [Catenulispora acidiphila DSM 44928]|uniref:Catalase n=1 Tax=Catenulispora acidiphila (strain DSM 44928 / JCM 14897 / NBRC 102108 / NRRL B-24433 / ID139908) TaxID=479433 RepID=C7Q967_CATAD|nr:catalase [Catenulispora acidiphila]ACU72387.1 Catalase [Catenulispora acidiphila DSM 44928]